MLMLKNRLLPRLAVTLVAAVALMTPSAPAQSSDSQALIRRDRVQLTLAGAQRAIAASLKQAERMGVKVNIAVVDDGGHLLAFARMDDARPSSVYTAITKATAAATHRVTTGPLGDGDANGAQLNLAIEQAAAASGGKYTSLKGGVPIRFGDQVIGAVGVGGAKGEQDAEVAEAGAAEVAKTFKKAAPDTAPDDTLTGHWLIESIAGRGVLDQGQTTLQIGDDGSVSGSAGVNRYMSKLTRDGQQIKFAPGPATTRMAGPPALMDQESKFLAALSKVSHYKIDDNGRLHLLDDAGQELLRASRMP